MIQQQKNNYKCRIHPEENISFCCLKPNCFDDRMFCFKCLKLTQHLQHMDAVNKFEDAEIFINQQIRKLREVIAITKNQFKQTKESFDILIKGLEERVYSFEANMNQMDIYQIEETLTISFQLEKVQQTIQQSIEKSISKIRKEIDDLCQNCQLNIFVQKNEIVLLSIANYLLSQQEHQKAIEYYDECLKMNSKNEQALFGKGDCLKVKQQYIKALECFEKVSSINEQAYIKQGECLQYLNRFDSAIQVYQKAISINPSNFYSQFNLGACFQETMNFAEAKKCFQKVIDLSTDDDYVLLAKSKLFFYQGQLDQTIKLLNQILEKSPRNYQAYHFLFECLQVVEEKEELSKMVEKMLEFYPEDLKALFMKAITLLNLQNFIEAQKIVEKIGENDSAQWMVQHLKAIFLLFEDHLDKSLELLYQNLAINPQNTSILLQIGLILIQFKQYDQAEKFYNDRLTKNPKDLLTLFLKGQLLYKQKKYDEAVQIYDFYLSIAQENFQISYMKAECLKKQKKYSETIEFCEKMLEIYPENEIFIQIRNNVLELVVDNNEEIEKKDIQQSEEEESEEEEEQEEEEQEEEIANSKK